MSKKRAAKFGLLFLIAIAILVVAGCGSEDYTEPSTKVGSYVGVVIPWGGGQMHCIRLDTGTQQMDDSGLSCDWERWHRETGQ